jgi:hypothetical protein
MWTSKSRATGPVVQGCAAVGAIPFPPPDSLKEGCIKDIGDAWRCLGAISPNTKDVHRVRIGRK